MEIQGDIAGLEARYDAAGYGTLHNSGAPSTPQRVSNRDDICPCRDNAQPHIVRDGECVLCLKRVRLERD